MSNSIEFGKPKMSISVGIGKRNEKPYYTVWSLGRETSLKCSIDKNVCVTKKCNAILERYILEAVRGVV